MTTFQEALQVVRSREAGLRAVPAAGRGLRVDDGSLVGEDVQLALGSQGLGLLCQAVSAPASYIGRLEPHIQGTLLTHHLGRGDLGPTNVTLFERDGALVGVVDAGLALLTATETLAAVAEGTGGADLTVDGVRFAPDESLEIDLLGPEADLGQDDLVRGGLRLNVSLVGEQATQIATLVWRQVCSNGLAHRRCGPAARTRRLPVTIPHARELQLEQVRRLAAGVWTSLAGKLDHLQQLPARPVDVLSLLERWLTRARLGLRRLRPLLEDAWDRDGRRQTLWAAVNVLSFLGTHADALSLRERRALAQLAGLLAFRELHLCPRCFSLVTGGLRGGDDGLPEGPTAGLVGAEP